MITYAFEIQRLNPISTNHVIHRYMRFRVYQQIWPIESCRKKNRVRLVQTNCSQQQQQTKPFRESGITFSEACILCHNHELISGTL